MKILIVDDEPLIIKAIRTLIKWQENDFSIVGCASNGMEALNLMKNHDVNIILTDIKMPVMDGLELIRHVNEMYKHVKIVVLSSYDDFHLVSNAFKLGARDYILKQELEPEKILELCIKLREDIISERNRSQLKIVEGMYPTENHLIAKAKAYINKHIGDELSLKIVADYLNISYNHLSRLFQKELGCSFIDYVNMCRMEKAKDYMMNSNLKIYEISQNVGFNNVEHFSRCFKKIVGVSPKTFMNSKIY